MSEDWPVAEIDPVRRMRVLAVAIPGAEYAEGLVEASFEEVWAVASDLEREFPRLLPSVHSMRIVEDHGERLVAVARGGLGKRARFRIVLRPGWCWMQSRLLIGGMAAVPEGDATRFGFLGGLRVPGVRRLAPLLGGSGSDQEVVNRLRRRLG